MWPVKDIPSIDDFQVGSTTEQCHNECQNAFHIGSTTEQCHNECHNAPILPHWFYNWAMPQRMPQRPDTSTLVLQLSNATTPRYFHIGSTTEQCHNECHNAPILPHWSYNWAMPQLPDTVLPHWFYNWAMPHRMPHCPDTSTLVIQLSNVTTPRYFHIGSTT